MSVTKPVVYDGGFQRSVAQGDLLGANEVVATLTTAGAGALTGVLLASNILSRTGPAGAVADTLDTPANIISAVKGPTSNSPNAGDTWRLRYINNVAFAITVTGVTGATVTNGVVNASSVKEFLVTLVNATPLRNAVATTTNASKTVTGMTQADTDNITTGMLVTGTGITGGTKVAAVVPSSGVLLDTNAIASTVGVVLTFSPVVTVLGLGQGLL